MWQEIKLYHACLLLPVLILQHNVWCLPCFFTFHCIYFPNISICVGKEDTETHILHLPGNVLGDFWIVLKAFYVLF